MEELAQAHHGMICMPNANRPEMLQRCRQPWKRKEIVEMERIVTKNWSGYGQSRRHIIRMRREGFLMKERIQDADKSHG